MSSVDLDVLTITGDYFVIDSCDGTDKKQALLLVPRGSHQYKQQNRVEIDSLIGDKRRQFRIFDRKSKRRGEGKIRSRKPLFFERR